MRSVVLIASFRARDGKFRNLVVEADFKSFSGSSAHADLPCDTIMIVGPASDEESSHLDPLEPHNPQILLLCII